MQHTDVTYRNLSMAEIIKEVPLELRLKSLTVEERLKGLPTEVRLKAAEEILHSLPQQERARLRKMLEDESSATTGGAQAN